MLEWLSNALSVVKRTTRANFDDPYTERQTWDIEYAGRQAAFVIVETALKKKIADLGLHCPIQRIEKGYSIVISIDAGNLRNSPMRWDRDANIILNSIGSSVDSLESSTQSVNKLLGTTFETDPQTDMVNFSVRCPTNSLYKNDPRKFMEFFQAIGFQTLSPVSDPEVNTRIKSGDTMWLGHTMGDYFHLAASGKRQGIDGANVLCPTVGLLQALDINPAEFAKAVTTARIEKAKLFGPVREKRAQALAYGKAFG